ncbi:MAG TPA: BTAD domain-containing putative transcriptional regulator [Gaiellaceae bacterium]|nr:BTAD domain-containing putative transcriptional regulator [Gaiellaceae bacterium]
MSQVSPARAGGRGRSARKAPPSHAVRLALLNGFELSRDGVSIPLPFALQRLLAFLALHGQPLLRTYVACNLWPDTTEERAHASLRSALWRLNRRGPLVVDADGARLQLGTAVDVDFRAARDLARRLVAETVDDATVENAEQLFDDLLPDWYDDWVLLEREGFRQLRLRALDALCGQLMRRGRLDDALAVGYAALAAEPLRESAHRTLMRIHLNEGNACEALRQYRLCRRLLGELGIEPSRQMGELVDGLVTEAGA